MNEWLALSSSLGLSGAAGLNAYIPLLLLGILNRLGFAHLHAPFDMLSNSWAIGVLGVLCLFELVIDKIPGVDHFNDVLQTFIRPTAGAILFASQSPSAHPLHPVILLLAGLLISGGVHAAKATARPVVNGLTFGIGAPIVSTIEDLLSTVISILAVLAPVLCLFVMAIFAYLAYKAIRLLVRRRRVVKVHAEAVMEEEPIGIGADRQLL